MTWIRTIAPAEADQALQTIYHRIYEAFPTMYLGEVRAVTRTDGSADSITASHSLLPGVMEPIFLAMARLLSPDLPLTRQQHELITTLVSSLNRCVY